ncbi:MAG: threonylcarbamoyl-AMP synthase [Acidimicrobiia bacterium]|nr:threonylcarbamoyl-AMP synthase [Acidimicrobiia bacterium]
MADLEPFRARAAAALRAGEVVLLPTDTVYGIAVRAELPGATARLFSLKDRAEVQPVAVLVADRDQALALAARPDDDAVLRVMEQLWPGPLTLVLRRAADAEQLELGGDPTTIGIRCPDHDFVRALAAEVGPLATTSANRHGEPTPASAAEAAASLVGPVALVVDGGPAGTIASTVVDLTGTEPRVLRQGAVTVADIERALAG